MTQSRAGVVDREEWVVMVPASRGRMGSPDEPGAERFQSQSPVHRLTIGLQDHGPVHGEWDQATQRLMHRADGAGTTAPMDRLVLRAPASLPGRHSTLPPQRSDGRRDDEKGPPIDEHG